MPSNSTPVSSHVVATGVAVGALAAAPLIWSFIKTCRSSVRMSMRNAGSVIAEVLKEHNCKRIFNLPGGHVSPIVVGCEKIGIKVIDVRHEVDAVFAADATARLTSELGVAIVTAGPGVTNTVTAVKNAQMAQTPLLLLGGASAVVLRGRGSLQDIDQMSVFFTITKYQASVSHVKDVVPVLRRAIQEAISGVPGPVFVEFPIDTLYPSMEVMANMGLVVRCPVEKFEKGQESRVVLPEEAGGASVATYISTLKPKEPVFLKPARNLPLVQHLYLTYQLKALFGGAWAPQSMAPLPAVFRTASVSQVHKAIALLSNAQRPVAIVGSQATVNKSIDVEKVSALLRASGIPCFLSGMARGLMGQDHPTFLRQNRRDALKQADVILLLGVAVDFRLDYGRAFPRRTKIIAVNRSSEELSRNTDVFWSPTLKVCADPADFIARVAPNVNSTGIDATWVAELKSKEQQKEAKNRETGKALATGRGEKAGVTLINPVALFYALHEAIKDRDDVILIGDGGDFVGTGANIVRPPKPLSWLDPGPFGTLGVGGGFALAAKLAFPEKHVILLWGDGSCGYSVAEYDPMKRHGANIIGIVGNDACWTQIVREQRPMLGSEAACNLAYCCYDAIAKGYDPDCFSASVTTVKDFETAIASALKSSTEGKNVLINALIGSSDFREGSISV